MHARCYLHVTAGHQGIQAARHICNIWPLKFKMITFTTVNFLENTPVQYMFNFTHYLEGNPILIFQVMSQGIDVAT